MLNMAFKETISNEPQFLSNNQKFINGINRRIYWHRRIILKLASYIEIMHPVGWHGNRNSLDAVGEILIYVGALRYGLAGMNIPYFCGVNRYRVSSCYGRQSTGA